MAILKMKKLKLAVVRSEESDFLKDLARLGCVQIDEMQDAEELSSETSNLIELKTVHAQLNNSIEILKSAVPEKGGLLSAKPEIDRDEFLDGTGIDSAIKHSRDILDADERIKNIRSEESRARADIESYKPWLDLDFPLNCQGTQRTTSVLGSFPVKLSLSDIEAAISSVSEEAEVFIVGEDKAYRYAVVICIKEDFDKVNDSIRRVGFSLTGAADTSLSAKEATKALEQKLVDLDAEKKEKEQFIVDSAQYRDEIKLGADKVLSRIEIASATEKIKGTDQVLFMNGWVPEKKLSSLEKLLEKYNAAYDVSDPTEEEYEDVPVKLQNNKFTNALNMVTDMYSLPAYGTVDPNPWMAPFFILFFGLMMADMGYGILMIVAAIVAFKKIKPRGNSLVFCQLLLYAGISTFICGALTGGFFSDVVSQIVTLATGTTWEMPHLFSPETNSTEVLVGALVLGVIQLNVGMVCGFIQKCKKGEVASAIFEEGALWIILIGGILTALAMVVGGSFESLKIPGLVVLGVGLLMLLFGAGREAKGFGKVTAAFGCIYNTSTGWFGDILSYSRIMALMLAGGVIGKVFNTVAIMPMQNSGVNPFTIAAFAIIFLLGHAMNFGLNLLGCYVHDLRLQCLEYFGKFYADGGKPFTPLDIKGKFINPKNN